MEAEGHGTLLDDRRPSPAKMFEDVFRRSSPTACAVNARNWGTEMSLAPDAPATKPMTMSGAIRDALDVMLDVTRPS